MSGKLADVGRRIASVRQLGAVVNAMRGIAGARAQQGRALLPGIRAYADTARRAIGLARHLDGIVAAEADSPGRSKPGLIVFGAEQGFAGPFAELVLDAAQAQFGSSHVFLIGSRTAGLAAERDLEADWETRLPNGAAGITETAILIIDALYDYLAEAGAVPVEMLYPLWIPGEGVSLLRRSLLPFDPQVIAVEHRDIPPLTNLPPPALVERLAQEYIFAQICEAAAEAFAAENEARAATMAAAKTNIDGKLAALELEERLTRQEEITAEVVELAAGTKSRQHTAA